MKGFTKLSFMLLFVTCAYTARIPEHKNVRMVRNDQKALPVVMWHGMGDSCCASYSLGKIKSLIEDKLGVYVHSIATGDGALGDVWSSYFGNVNDQATIKPLGTFEYEVADLLSKGKSVAKVCAELRSIPELANGYNAIGFSQGGQFMRAAIQRCQHLGPRAVSLITMGAQHQGVDNIPGCGTVPANLTGLLSSVALPVDGPQDNSRTACQTMQSLLSRGAYMPWVRDHLVQAQYFKDFAHVDLYLRNNPFLPDINNEKADKNQQYITNLASLSKLVLYRFDNDTTVVPAESAWFAELDRQGKLVAMEDTQLYQEDWIGLRSLAESGKLQLLSVPGQHMQFSLSWFEDNIIDKLLAAPTSDDNQTDDA